MKNLTLLISILVMLFVIVNVGFSSVTANTTLININYLIGAQQPSNVTISFTSTENVTLRLNKTSNDVSKNFFSITPTELFIAANETKLATISFNIPVNVTPGLYYSFIHYDSQVPIPVVFNITREIREDKCKIIPYITSLNTKMLVNQEATRRISLTVSQECEEPVKIGVELEGDVIGDKPATIIEESLGEIGPSRKTEGHFIILFNTTGVATGVYSITAKIIGVYKGYLILTSEIPIKLTVVGTSAPVSGMITEFPTCSIDTRMVMNNTYKFICTVLNPNINIQPLYNEYFVGISLETPPNQFIYTLKPVKEGETQFTAIYLYNNVPIGEPFKKNITIVREGTAGLLGRGLAFRFYPEKPTPGKELIVQCRDNLTLMLVPNCELRVNGVLLSNKTFVPESGKTYELSIDAPGYYPSFYNLTMEELKMVVFVTPTNPRVGEYLSITVKSEQTNETIEPDAIYLDDDLINATTFIVQHPGNHTIKIEKSGYKTVTKTITVKGIPSIVFVDEDMYKGKNFTIMLSSPASWEVYFRSDKQPQLTSVSSGQGDKITIIPREYGTYLFYVEGTKIYEKDLKGFTLPQIVPPDVSKALPPIAFSIMVVAIILFIIKRRKREETMAFELAPPKEVI